MMVRQRRDGYRETTPFIDLCAVEPGETIAQVVKDDGLVLVELYCPHCAEVLLGVL